jgi:Domain of Unknown Function (DUF349)
MGATHERGDFLEQLCQAWAMSRRRGVRIIESKINSVHGIDFAMETRDGDVFIFEVKSATGSLSAGQFTHAWLRGRIRAPLKTAIIRAVIRRRYVIREVVRVVERAGCEPSFRIGSPTDQLQWQDLFPDEAVPVLEMVGKSARSAAGQVEVTHQMQGYGLDETHVYRMAQAVLSAGLLKSILDNAMYPAIVPHTHVILENGVTRYSRGLSEWGKHLATKDDDYSGTVLRMACRQCRAIFFGFANEQACSPCQNRLGNAVCNQKTALIRAAQAVGMGGNDGAQWKAGNERMHQLLSKWKTIGHAGEAEGELWAQFTAARQGFFEQRQHYFDQQAQGRARNGREKQALLEAARSAAQSTDWKSGSEKMKDLMQRWKNIGPADKEQDQTLWEQFNAVRQGFFDRRNAWFEQMKQAHEHNRGVKLGLLEQAERYSGSSDWKNTSALMRELMEQWRGVGSAGQEFDDELWRRFQAARQLFYDSQDRFFAANRR